MLFVLLLLGCPATPPGADDDDASVDDDDASVNDDDALDDDDAADDDDATEDPSWRSTLYPADWSPGFTDAEGRYLHDFSYAGYHRGEIPLPEAQPSTTNVLDYGADPTGVTDSTAAIQAAIDATEQGTVLLPAGTYLIDDTLRIDRSNLVLAGEGPDETFLRFTRGTNMSDTGHIYVVGNLQRGPDTFLTDDATTHASTLPGLTPNTDVALGFTITDEFVAEHGMSDTWQAFNGSWQPIYRREVLADGTLDIPLRGPLLTRDDASVRTETGYLREVGVRDLSVSTSVDWAEAWSNDRSHAIRMHQVADAFVVNVHSFDPDDPKGRHLQSGGVMVVDSKRVTIADSQLGPSQNRGGGGNGYLFEVSRSGEVLIRDSVGTGGRHNFIQNWGFGTTGCVFLRTTSRDGTAAFDDSELFASVGLSEFHHSLAHANLIDSSVADDGWGAVNRGDWSSGAGHSASENVFWNTSGAGILRTYQYGWGYVIGTQDITVQNLIAEDGLFSPGAGTEPDDWVEGAENGANLTPSSLYEDQLARRLDR